MSYQYQPDPDVWPGPEYDLTGWDGRDGSPDLPPLAAPAAPWVPDNASDELDVDDIPF